VSWPLASFTLVALVLFAGWLAYERSRPSARMAAVVATLAAVAALGRDAFVALPEVKPITAIVLVVGYALGPLPGFTVGAIGMLASNVVLGQGPYTPWQMAAWGGVGVAGAVLARLTGRRLGRVRLALACGVTALAAKEVMDVYTWSIGAVHTPAAYLAIAGGTALPFDLVDAVASFGFGLAFAPELARVLERTRARMDISWEAAGATTLLPALVLGLAGALVLPGGTAHAGGSRVYSSSRLVYAAERVSTSGGLVYAVQRAYTSGRRVSARRVSSGLRVSTGGGLVYAVQRAYTSGRGRLVYAAERVSTGSRVSTGGRLVYTAKRVTGSPRVSAGGLHVWAGRPRAFAARANLSREVAYLASAQNSDGGWGGAVGQPSSELYSAWAAIGLAAAGRSPQSVRRDGHTVLEALRAAAGTLEGPGDIERTMLALRACGAPTTSLAGKNLLADLLRYRGGEGSFSHQVNLTAFAIFALRAAGRSAADPAVRAAGAWIARQQNSDDGFNFAERGGSSDVDDTAAALQSLIAAGIHSGAGVTRAVGFIVHAQNPDGGFPLQPGGESNAQSTAWAVQGLVAAGSDVEAVRRHGSRSPLGYLESLVAPNGSVRYSRTSAQAPVWVTAQALTALARAPFPIG
jgi:hypothetical protein